MADIPTMIETFLSSFFDMYIAPYLPFTVLVLLAVAFGSWLGSRRKIGGEKKALRAELMMNLVQARAILKFVESQKGGELYVTPIPRFYTAAYRQLRLSGNLGTLKRGIREELDLVYSTIDEIDAASDRQEELLTGVPATSPIAEDLRSANLTYVRDSVSNIVLPRLEQFPTFTRR